MSFSSPFALLFNLYNGVSNNNSNHNSNNTWVFGWQWDTWNDTYKKIEQIEQCTELSCWHHCHSCYYRNKDNQVLMHQMRSDCLISPTKWDAVTKLMHTKSMKKTNELNYAKVKNCKTKQGKIALHTYMLSHFSFWMLTLEGTTSQCCIE